MALQVDIPKRYRNRHEFLTWCQRIAERRGQSYRKIIKQYEPRFRRFQRREFSLMDRLKALRIECERLAEECREDVDALWTEAWEHYRQTGTIEVPRR